MWVCDMHNGGHTAHSSLRAVADVTGNVEEVKRDSLNDLRAHDYD